MRVGQFGIDQKYRDRKRYLYALSFSNGCVYIGQTVNLQRRTSQHKASKGGWQGQTFTCTKLGEVYGTEALAIDHEHAWRFVAHQAGKRIYGLPSNVIVKPVNQMTPQRYAIAKTLRWKHLDGASSIWGWMKWLAAGIAASVALTAMHIV